MGFRFRRSTRPGPLRFNYRFAGLRLQQGGLELDLCWRARRLLQLPIALTRSPTRSPLVLRRGLPNSRRLRPGQLDALKQSLLGVLRQELFAGEQLGEHALVSRLLADGSLGARTTGLLALIETPETIEPYLLRSQGQDDAWPKASAKSGAALPQRCITAVQEASRLAVGRGWLA